MKHNLISSIKFWLFILLFSCFVCYIFFQVEEKNVSYIKTAESKNVKIIERTKSFKQFPIIYAYKISYKIDGKEYTGIIKSINNYKKDQLKIYYQVESPEWITEAKTINNSIISFRLSILFPIYALIMILVNILRIIMINNIIKNKNYVLGTISNIEVLNSHAINKNYLLEAVYNGDFYKTIIDSIENNYIKCNNINKIRIYFIKNNKYYIDRDYIHKKVLKRKRT